MKRRETEKRKEKEVNRREEGYGVGEEGGVKKPQKVDKTNREQRTDPLSLANCPSKTRQ